MVRRRKRDAYGNRVWEEESISNARGEEPSEKMRTSSNVEDESIRLDWRDFVALSIASLETFLLPVVVFIVLFVAIVVGLSFFR